jgi:large subunit ribosomal protein L14e
MYEIGRLCVKTAGRDARNKCVIIEILNDNYVLIDGQTRRKKCNIDHLEPIDKVIKIKKGAAHSEVVEALKKEGIEVIEKKPKEKVSKKTKP